MVMVTLTQPWPFFFVSISLYLIVNNLENLFNSTSQPKCFVFTFTLLEALRVGSEAKRKGVPSQIVKAKGQTHGWMEEQSDRVIIC